MALGGYANGKSTSYPQAKNTSKSKLVPYYNKAENFFKHFFIIFC